MTTVADPDLELRRGGGGGGFVLLALPAFLSSVISSSFTQNKGGRAFRAPPLDPPLDKPLVNIPSERDRLFLAQTIAVMTIINARKQIAPGIIPYIALFGKPFCSSLFSAKKYIYSVVNKVSFARYLCAVAGRHLD